MDEGDDGEMGEGVVKAVRRGEELRVEGYEET